MNYLLLSLLESGGKLKQMKEKTNKQRENLKLRLLIASRERNVYLEKLRKLEEFGENKDWKDKKQILKSIYDILYNDNHS